MTAGVKPSLKRPAVFLLILGLLSGCRMPQIQSQPTPQPSPASAVTLEKPPSAVPTFEATTVAPSSTALRSPTPTEPTLEPTASPILPHPIDIAGASRLDAQLIIRFEAWDLVTALAWSPDGQKVAVGAGERVYLYRTAGWQAESSYRVASLTASLAFSPDGGWLAAGSRDGRLRAWRTADFAASAEPAPVLDVEAHRKGVNTVAFSPQFGQAGGTTGWLLASGGNDAVARFWDLSSAANIGLMVGGTFAVPSIAFLPGGDLLAVTNGDLIRLREVGTERIVGTFAADAPLYSLTASPDGRILAAGGSDNLIRLYEVEKAYRTGQEEYPDPIRLSGHNGNAGTFRALVWQMAYSPGGSLLASVGGDGSLRVWDPAAASQIGDYPAHPGGATAVAFDPTGTWIITGGLDGGVLLWRAGPE